MRKILKFVPELARLILQGTKTRTFRLFDDKKLESGDELTLAIRYKDQILPFAEALITDVYRKRLEEINEKDFVGHEQIDDDLVAYYRHFYGSAVTVESEVKIVTFLVTKKFWITQLLEGSDAKFKYTLADGLQIA